MSDKQQEMLDIFDERMRHIGTASRSESHARGLWHQTFHCWVVSDRPERSLLFQRRHLGKETFPGRLDVSCAGHLLAGEQVKDGLRELEEELGVVARFDELIPCGIYPEVQRISESITDREFCHVFLYRSEQPLHEYRLQPDEVTGLYRIPLAVVHALIEGSAEPFFAEGVEPDPERDGLLRTVTRRFQADDLVPHSPEYYRHILDQAGKLGSV